MNKPQGVKPFRLVKFFTFFSLIIMFAATIFISVLNAHWVQRILLEKNKADAALRVKNFNYQVYIRFATPIVFLHKEQINLDLKPHFSLLDDVVRSTLHGYNVEEVTIYNPANIIRYSYDVTKIGKKNAGGIHFEKALKKEATSRIVHQGNFWQLMFGIPQETKIITFAPVWDERELTPFTGLMGVVEIIQDVSDDYKKIFELQVLIIGSCFIVMGILFIILLQIVRHGEKIIEKRAEERLKLEEKLRRSEHLSAIGEMTAGVSHEIRNPLGIIKSSAQLLKNKMAKLDANSSIPDIIVEESGRLNNIITDFLDFAKPKFPDIHPCKVEDIIEKNIAYLTPRVEENHFQITKEIPEHLPEILADSSMLYQAFLNIFINAFQSLKNNGCLTIRITHNIDRIIINFIDEGDGIDEAVLKKIWTPFFTTKDTGTGLGLGIVKNIIEAHAGTIRITNRDPKGADVEIILPA